MTNEQLTAEQIRAEREQIEATRDEPMSEPVHRPGHTRSRILAVRLTDEEYAELNRYADAVEVPASSLTRGWILDHLRAETDSPGETINRITHELSQLRRQLDAATTS